MARSEGSNQERKRQALDSTTICSGCGTYHEDECVLFAEIERLEEKSQRMAEDMESMSAGWARTTAERDALLEEVERLSLILWGARCIYCGSTVGPEKRNQDIGDEELRQHIKVCPQHPLPKAIDAMRRAANELGVPQPGYPAPVANAASILRDALEPKP